MTDVRPAVFEDVPWLIAMGTRFIRETEYRHHMAVDHATLSQLMASLMDNDEAIILVVGERPHGMIGMIIFDHPMSGEKFASELFWWTDPDQRGEGIKLLKAAERWAKEAGAVRIQMVAPNDRTAQAYERLGYSKIETHYQRGLA